MIKLFLLKIYYKLFPKLSLREEILEQSMRLVSMNGVESGDYLEFGVNNGKSFMAAYKMAQKFGLTDMKFYAFDSFEGLPEISGLDREVMQFQRGEYSTTREQFLQNLAEARVDLSKVKTISGWYDQVLNIETKKSLALKQASVIWIDCDLYESTVPVLNFISDYVVDGTVLIFDDWFCFRGSPKLGEQKAFLEWLERNHDITATEYYKHGFFGNSFILHRG